MTVSTNAQRYAYAYHASLDIYRARHPFYAIIMAAMRDADTLNLASLKRCWPDVWEALQELYNTPMGEIPGGEVEPTEPPTIDLMEALKASLAREEEG